MADLDRFVDALDRAMLDMATTPAPSTVDATFTLEDAYAVQDRLVARRLAEGRSRAGWKLGLTTAPPPAVPISGVILDSMVHRSGTVLSLGSFVAAQLEAELVFVIGEDIGGQVTAGELRAGPHRVAAGIELIDYRTTGSTGPADWVADNSTVAGAVVGDALPVADMDLAAVQVTLSHDGVELARGHGGLVMGDPLEAVAWLSGHLAGRGLGLRRGEVVLTGSLTGHHPADPGTYVAAYDLLGDVSVTFLS